MEVKIGLFDRMVFQRDLEKNVSRQKIEGLAGIPGTVWVRVTDEKGKTVLERGLGETEGKEHVFSVCLEGLPCGGPYEIFLSVRTSDGEPAGEEYTASGILVGDVWMLGGQSNMEGIGNLSGAPEPDPLVRACYMDDRWDVAEDPIHNLDKAAAEIHWILRGGHGAAPRNPLKGVGPAVSFAREMRKATGVPQGLIASAHGGTTMAQWSPSLKDRGDESLYGAMLRRFLRNGGSVRGMLWYQGCSDANAQGMLSYAGKTRELIESVRSDFHDADMPFVMVQISRLVPGTENFEADAQWSRIREEERRLGTLANVAVVPAIDLELDDPIHLSGESQQRLGRRLAGAALTLLQYPGALPPPIEFDRIETQWNDKLNECVLTVFFRNVVGNLSSGGVRPFGFTCVAGERPRLHIFRTELCGDCVKLHLMVPMPILAMMSLAYGYGRDPYVNITDSADRSLPAFGPLEIRKEEFPVTPFASKVQVSDPVFGEDSFEALVYPHEMESLHFSPVVFDVFYVRPEDVSRYSGKAHIRYFRSVYEFPEDLDAQIRFGYDGPVRLFLDGREIFSDPHGTNPIDPDAQLINQHIPRGTHEFLTAFSPRKGASWGISFRIADRKRIPEEERGKEDLSFRANLPLEKDS